MYLCVCMRYVYELLFALLRSRKIALQLVHYKVFDKYVLLRGSLDLPIQKRQRYTWSIYKIFEKCATSCVPSVIPTEKRQRYTRCIYKEFSSTFSS